MLSISGSKIHRQSNNAIIVKYSQKRQPALTGKPTTSRAGVVQGERKLPASPFPATKKGTRSKDQSAKAMPKNSISTSNQSQHSTQKQAERSVADIAKECLLIPDNMEGKGFVYIRFNHYNKPFPIHNSVLKWCDVDEVYCISFVYRGMFTRNLYYTENENGARVTIPKDEDQQYFISLTNAGTYWLEVIEDATAGVGADGLRLNDGPIKFSQITLPAITSGNKAVNDITNQLKSMKTSQLSSAEANDLRERRDIEDVLFSGV